MVLSHGRRSHGIACPLWYPLRSIGCVTPQASTADRHENGQAAAEGRATKRTSERALRAEATRRRLIEASLRVFAQKGFAGSTTKDIAAAAGVTDGLIYHYFRSKEELLWAGVEMHNMAPQIAQLGQRIGEMKEVDAGLEAVFSGLFEALSEQEDLVVMFFAESQRNPDLQKGLLSLIDDGVEALAAPLEAKLRCDADYLRFCVRNSLMAAVTYFLTHDRFAHDAAARARYVRLSARQLASSLLHGRKGS